MLIQAARTVKLQGFPKQVPAWFPGWDTLQWSNGTVVTARSPARVGGGGTALGKGGGRGQGPLKAESGRFLEPGSPAAETGWAGTHPRPTCPVMVVYQ